MVDTCVRKNNLFASGVLGPNTIVRRILYNWESRELIRPKLVFISFSGYKSLLYQYNKLWLIGVYVFLRRPHLLNERLIHILCP